MQAGSESIKYKFSPYTEHPDLSKRKLIKIQWIKFFRVRNSGPRFYNEGYQPITCLACRQVHLVKPKTAKVLGAADKQRASLSPAPAGAPAVTLCCIAPGAPGRCASRIKPCARIAVAVAIHPACPVQRLDQQAAPKYVQQRTFLAKKSARKAPRRLRHPITAATTKMRTVCKEVRSGSNNPIPN